MEHLLLLCHDGSWERLYQALSCAGSAAAQDARVDMVFYFGALRRLVDRRLDEFDRPELEAVATELGTPSLSRMLADARASGRVRIHACSASVALEELDLDAVRSQVDEIVGWPTVIRWMGQGASTLYL